MVLHKYNTEQIQIPEGELLVICRSGKRSPKARHLCLGLWGRRYPRLHLQLRSSFLLKDAASYISLHYGNKNNSNKIFYT